jgi:hypothetical protein
MMGGKPSKNTPKDMRLKRNQQPANKPAVSKLFGGKKAPPFTKKGA